MIVLIKQSPQINAEQLILDYLDKFISESTRGSFLSLIDLGLIVEMRNLKEYFMENEDYENHARLIGVAREMNQMTKEMEGMGKGVHRELSRFQLLGYSNKL